MSDFYWLKSGINPFSGGGIDADEYHQMIRDMLALEPWFILKQILKGQNPDENIKHALEGRMEDIALMAKASVNSAGGKFIFIREMLTIEAFTKQVLDKNFKMPERFKKLLPKGSLQNFKREAGLIADLWEAMWRCLVKAHQSVGTHPHYLHQHPSTLFYLLLLESPDSNLFTTGNLKKLTAQEFVESNQRINAYLNDLDSVKENPFPGYLYATRLTLDAMRMLAEKNDEFRKTEYKQLKKIRSALVEKFKYGKMFVTSLDKPGITIRNHLQGKKTN